MRKYLTAYASKHHLNQGVFGVSYRIGEEIIFRLTWKTNKSKVASCAMAQSAGERGGGASLGYGVGL